MTRKIGRKLGNCDVQKPKNVPRKKQVTVSKSAETPKRMIPEKFNGLAKLEMNVVRAVSMEGVRIEVSLNWNEEWEVRQMCTTLSKSLAVNGEERSITVSREQGSREAKSFHFTKGR